MNEKKDMKTCIRPCVLMINECDKRYIIFKIFFTLIQGLLPATFIIIMQKIINLKRGLLKSNRTDNIMKLLKYLVVTADSLLYPMWVAKKLNVSVRNDNA